MSIVGDMFQADAAEARSILSRIIFESQNFEILVLSSAIYLQLTRMFIHLKL